MKHLFCVFCILIAIFGYVPANAQSQNSDNVTVSQDNISELIETLESETARSEFIQNLKALQDAKISQENTEEHPSEAVTDILGIEDSVTSFVHNYESFLAENNLSTSLIGKSTLTVLSFLCYLALSFLVRKGGVTLRNKLLQIKNRYSITHDRFRIYARLIRYAGYTIVTALFIYTLGIVWNITNFGFLQTDLGTEILGNFLSVILVAVFAALFWELLSGLIDFAMRSSENFGSSKRMRTLLPIVHNVMFVIFAALFTLVLLSELGINIMPLLAGAGIFGIAVGFGAQTMVKDFLTGFTIILEDLIQVGDVAKVGGCTGFIEKITLRKVQLRALDGTVYTVPFSEINIVENLTKEFSYYILDVGIAYREDTDEVIKYLKEIDEDMRSDDEFKNLMLEPIEIFGVDQFADSAVVIKARLKTQPIRQWDVGREFNRRMKYKFDEHGIEIPFPHQTIYFGEDKQGKAPPAYIEMQERKQIKNQTKKPAAEKSKTKKS